MVFVSWFVGFVTCEMIGLEALKIKNKNSCVDLMLWLWERYGVIKFLMVFMNWYVGGVICEMIGLEALHIKPNFLCRFNVIIMRKVWFN